MRAPSVRRAFNELFRPASVIASSHANEAGTVGGMVRPRRKTKAFVKAVEVPVHVSGKAMEFDATVEYRAGC